MGFHYERFGRLEGCGVGRCRGGEDGDADGGFRGGGGDGLGGEVGEVDGGGVVGGFVGAGGVEASSRGSGSLVGGRSWAFLLGEGGEGAVVGEDVGF